MNIDHVVIAVPDLDTAVEKYTQLGFTVVPGGRHPTGTHNALIAFADGTYVELLAFYQPTPESWFWAKAQQGGGLADFCMRTNDLQAKIAAFRKAGIQMKDATPLSRVRPDGYHLSWLLSMPEGEYRGVVPFLIEDETPREERLPRETVHKNRVTGIGALTVAVDDIATVRRWYADILGDDGREIERKVRFVSSKESAGLYTATLTTRDGTGLSLI